MDPRILRLLAMEMSINDRQDMEASFVPEDGPGVTSVDMVLWDEDDLWLRAEAKADDGEG